ncbi:hypothetical protein L2750_12865 [Shewanella submarina]|uniref:Uncharacterized protein n=1 Tax=Shewanella submarina TaxID=2016376 RepID=A0ABV7GHB5_9GAMM|nr:hypothetical protein [Shewanella submarina]MCL1038041.1 hypothetical protein [Shewanella submarina]
MFKWLFGRKAHFDEMLASELTKENQKLKLELKKVTESRDSFEQQMYDQISSREWERNGHKHTQDEFAAYRKATIEKLASIYAATDQAKVISIIENGGEE